MNYFVIDFHSKIVYSYPISFISHIPIFVSVCQVTSRHHTKVSDTCNFIFIDHCGDVMV